MTARSRCCREALPFPCALMVLLAAPSSTDPNEISNGFISLAYLIGWANGLLECDNELCMTAANRKCTP